MLLGFNLLKSLERRRLIICGDSHLVLRQIRGEIECKASVLSPLRSRTLNKLQPWPSHGTLHVKRDWNQSANQLVTALHKQEGVKSTPSEERSGLEAINRLSELVVPEDHISSTKIYAVIRSRCPIRISGKIMQEEVVQRLRVDRI